MKTFLTSCLSAVALLALGGCASIPAVTSTENDGVYYSSKDRTTENPAYTAAVQSRLPDVPTDQPTVATPSSSSDAQYSQDGGYASSGTTVYTDDAYYDSYDYDYAARIRRFHQPSYWSFAPSYYSYAYTNSWDPWGYNPYAYSPWAYRYGYNDPYGYGYGYGSPYVSINIGYGWPYRSYGGWGGYGWGYRTGYYNGYNNGYYDSPYYGGGNSGSRRNVNYGPRRDRSSNITAGTSGVGRGRLVESGTSGGRGTVPTTPPSTGGLVTGGRSSSPTAERPIPARGRVVEGGKPAGQGGRVAEQPTRATEPTNDPRTNRPGRVAESVPASTADMPVLRPATEAQPTSMERPRRRILEAATENQGESQPRRQQREQVYTPAPAEQPTRSSERPSRSYEPSSAPSRSSSPSPSGSGSNNGGSRGRGRAQ